MMKSRVFYLVRLKKGSEEEEEGRGRFQGGNRRAREKKHTSFLLFQSHNATRRSPGTTASRGRAEHTNNAQDTPVQTGAALINPVAYTLGRR